MIIKQSSLVISFQMTELEYFEYSYYTAWVAPWNKRKRFLYHIRNIFIGFLFIIVLVLIGGENTFKANAITALWFSVIYFTLLIFTSKDRFRRAARKNYNNPNNERLFSKLELSFNEEGIMSKDEFSESQSKWSAIIKRHSTQNLYILYPSDLAGLVIPKRVFKSETEKEAFEKMLTKYVPLHADLPALNN